jgi:DNA-directed RNA polymerase subunit RPC12/RpoP
MKVIKPGRDDYRAVCDQCGCEFTYTLDDVQHNYIYGGDAVRCPHCSKQRRHYGVEREVIGRRDGHG